MQLAKQNKVRRLNKIIMKQPIRFSFLLLVCILFSFKDECGAYRWYVKTLTDNQGVEVFNLAATPSTLSNLITESRAVPDHEHDSRLRYKDEHRKVRLEVTLYKIKEEANDHDFHIILKAGDNTMVGEVPDGNCGTFDNHLALRKHFNELRSQIIEAIDFVPSGKLRIVNRKVIVEGIPFWDENELEHKPTGSAANQHEIHPITKITFE